MTEAFIAPIVTPLIVLVLWLVWRVWGWLGKRRKKAPKLPWNGVHQLKYILSVEFAMYPDDYYSGWEWKCTCGTGTFDYRHMAASEAAAMSEFKKHLEVYKGACNCFGS